MFLVLFTHVNIQTHIIQMQEVSFFSIVYNPYCILSCMHVLLKHCSFPPSPCTFPPSPSPLNQSYINSFISLYSVLVLSWELCVVLHTSSYNYTNSKIWNGNRIIRLYRYWRKPNSYIRLKSYWMHVPSVCVWGGWSITQMSRKEGGGL